MAGSVTLITGPMFSGKTSTLITAIDDCKETFVIIRHTSDRRYLSKDSADSSQRIVSNKLVAHNRNSVSGLSIWCSNLGDLPPLDKYRNIFIDEGQFFDTLSEFCDEQAKKGISVMVAGLSGTYERLPFPSISKLISLCDEIIFLTAECTCCGQAAAFSRRIVNCETFILIGGHESYEARCRSCFDLPPLLSSNGIPVVGPEIPGQQTR